MKPTAEERAAMATNCSHVSQHFDVLVACGECIAAAIRSAEEAALQEERKAICENLCEGCSAGERLETRWEQDGAIWHAPSGRQCRAMAIRSRGMA